MGTPCWSSPLCLLGVSREGLGPVSLRVQSELRPGWGSPGGLWPTAAGDGGPDRERAPLGQDGWEAPMQRLPREAGPRPLPPHQGRHTLGTEGARTAGARRGQGP